MFKARTSQTMLTICGMSIGIGAILFLVSLGYGLQKTLLERITTSESLLTLDVTEAKAGVVTLNQKTLDNLNSMEGVAEVSSAFQLTAQGNMDDLSADIVAVGTDPTFLRLGGFKAEIGELLKSDSPNDVVITAAVSQLFGKSTEEMMNKEIKFTFFVPDEEPATAEGGENLQTNYKRIDFPTTYVVKGVIEGEDNVVYINSSTLGDLKIDRFSQVKVKCQNNNIMGVVRDKILESGLLASSLSDTVDQANKIFSVIQIILMLFGIIALVVSAIGMFNTMTIALLERTEEIGIMKSIGASGTSVASIFFMEAAIMGFLGGIGGIIIGLVGGQAFNALINLIAARFGGEKVSLFYSPAWFVSMILIFSAVVGIFTGFIPARRASKVDPLEALRYK
jgi:ABC-type antimicrobial peptide transport system permease subunit